MIDDFELIVHKFNDREDRHIYLLGDVHLGAKECLEAEFAKFLQMVKDDYAGYLILLGDLLNNGVKSSVTNVYDEVLMPGNAKRQMIEYLEPVSDKILCAVTGNHERRTLREDDMDITYDIMSQLGIEERCRRNIAFLKLQFGNPRSSRETNPQYMFACTHGAGGGALPGGVINRNQRFADAFEGLDCLCTGHSHKPMTYAMSKLRIDHAHNRVQERTVKIAVASSWLRYSGYPTAAMLPPTGRVINRIDMCGDKKHMEVII